MNSTIIAELSPGPSVQTDDEWDAWTRNNAGTEYLTFSFHLNVMFDLDDTGSILHALVPCYLLTKVVWLTLT